ncbi:unnamed protein product [Paramecium pentaurelia]|uniref:Phosphagen kinase N-terminal domain-containing protein n=1 Tax=Paramecium pentaurelia TaxID=43138 RepID=A0A8S1U7A1_9CILI|nr:unnamed protein product [Paramecium pentaurelia]
MLDSNQYCSILIHQLFKLFVIIKQQAIKDLKYYMITSNKFNINACLCFQRGSHKGLVRCRRKGKFSYVRWIELGKIKVILRNKYITPAVEKKVKSLSDSNSQKFLDVMMGCLSKDDSSVAIYATRPEDYDVFSFYLEPLIREYHKIEGQTNRSMIGTSKLENMFLQKQIQDQKKCQ